jgi:hypothetical protein
MLAQLGSAQADLLDKLHDGIKAAKANIKHQCNQAKFMASLFRYIPTLWPKASICFLRKRSTVAKLCHIPDSTNPTC